MKITENPESTAKSMRSQIIDNLKNIESRIERACKKAGRPRSSVRLIAVTKNHSADTVQALIDQGLCDIGENRVQEIVQKAPFLKGDFKLHLIGHLQTNKVHQVLPHISWIHSIDRERLVSRIEFCRKEGPSIPALVEVNTSGEASKSGCTPDACRSLCERVRASSALDFRGLMTIGPLGAAEKETRAAFTLLRSLAEKCGDGTTPLELSMGMSEDFEWAIEEGATMIRIGTALLGART